MLSSKHRLILTFAKSTRSAVDRRRSPRIDPTYQLMVEEIYAKMEEEDAEHQCRGDAEEGIDRDSAWAKDMKRVSHFGERNKMDIAEATEWVGSRARQRQEPFGAAGTEAALRKYSIVGQRYLCFCYRAYKLGREEADARLATRFTCEQWSQMGDLVLEAEDERLDESQD